MDILSFSVFRKQLTSVLDKVNDDHKPVMIKRKNGKPVIIMSVEDFRAYEETAYLMASSKNAKRLNEALGEVEMIERFKES